MVPLATTLPVALRVPFNIAPPDKVVTPDNNVLPIREVSPVAIVLPVILVLPDKTVELATVSLVLTVAVEVYTLTEVVIESLRTMLPVTTLATVRVL